MASNELVRQQRLQALAEAAIQSIGLGFDMTMEYRLDYCKNSAGRLIDIVNDGDQVHDLYVPGGISTPNVPSCIKCDSGGRTRIRSDVLPFQQMSEQFNQEASLSGRIPSGHFNAAFEYTGSWQKDAANTKLLAFDCVSVILYTIELNKLQIALSDHVKKAIPSNWDPVALSKFIEKYGTHFIKSVTMGGKDAIYVKQYSSSPLEAAEVQKSLEDVAGKRFIDERGKSDSHLDKTYNEAMLERIEHGLTFIDSNTLSIYSHKEDITFFWRRRGGSNEKNMPRDKWCQSVKLEPELISMSFVPILSLLSGVHGSGFLSHAINLYLRCKQKCGFHNHVDKPPIDVLHQFLDFQLPRQWAPVFGELSMGPAKHRTDACLQFSFLGPRLYISSEMVDVGKRPVVGVRLYLGRNRNSCLMVQLQHLSSCPIRFQLQTGPDQKPNNCIDRRYHEKIGWKIFSHVCTFPVESDDDLSVVTGAQFEVVKDVLFLQLHFSRVAGAILIKKPEWVGSSSEKSGLLSSVASFISGQKPAKKLPLVDLNSAVYPGGPPIPQAMSQLSRLVDTNEVKRGPEDRPGFWIVSGARLVVENGKISISVKYSLLSMDLPRENA